MKKFFHIPHLLDPLQVNNFTVCFFFLVHPSFYMDKQVIFLTLFISPLLSEVQYIIYVFLQFACFHLSISWKSYQFQRFLIHFISFHQKTEIMASVPITSQQIDGETVETVADFIFLGSKITADGDCSHEVKRRLLLGRKVMTNLDSILKSRDTTLSTKVRLVKAMVFPVVMYGCESWTIKKAEH